MSHIEVNDISYNNYYPIEGVSNYTQYSSILFIDSSLEIPGATLFSQSVNDYTFPLIYNFSTSRNSIVEFLNNFTNVKRIAFAFHGTEPDQPANNSFINTERYYTVEDLIDNQTVFSENVSFVKNLTQQFSLTNIDFLACNILTNNDWQKYFTLLQNDSNVILGASDDDTGNLKYGGDWVLENTMENIKSIYFNDSISTYADILLSITVVGINYTTTDNNARVTGPNTASGSIVIPATITYNGIDYSVTAIEQYAFSNATALTSITMPTSVTIIEKQAFRECTLLTTVTIPNDSVITIKADVFYKCVNLTTITLPNSLTDIPYAAFFNCSSLTDIVVDDGNTTYNDINGVLFKGTTLQFYPSGKADQEYTIPSGTTTIGSHSFFNTQILETLIIPELVTNIDGYAFANNSDSGTDISNIEIWSSNGEYRDLTGNIALDNDIYYWTPTGTYYGDMKILVTFETPEPEPEQDPTITYITTIDNVTHSINISGDLIKSLYTNKVSTTDILRVEIGTSVTSIGNYAFRDASNMTEITIPTSVTSIGESAFQKATQLTSITMPTSVTIIEKQAFRECTLLTTVTIPNDSVITIKGDVFYKCVNLLTITLPNSLTDIAYAAFFDCSSLTDIVVDDGNTTYNDINGVLFKGTTLQFYPSGKTDQEYTIPSGTTTIGSHSFFNTQILETLIIPELVTNIDGYAFANNSDSGTDISNIEIWSSNGEYRDLTGNIALDNDIYYWTPTGTYYGDMKILVTFETPPPEPEPEQDPTITYITTIDNVTHSINISGDLIKSLYTNKVSTTDILRVEIGTSVTSIGNYAFRDASNMTEITIPTSVTSIGESAFQKATQLSSITMPTSVTIIEKQAFRECTLLTTVTIPNDSVITIKADVFYKCVNLTTITLPNSLTDIPYAAFFDCSSLTDIVVDDGNTTYNDINGVLFKGTTLQFYPSGKTDQEYTIPSGTTTIGSHSFFNTQILETLIIPELVTNIDGFAFANNSDSGTDISNIEIWSSNGEYRDLTGNIALDNDIYYWTPTGTYYGDMKILVTFETPPEPETFDISLNTGINIIHIPKEGILTNINAETTIYKYESNNYSTITITNNSTDISNGSYFIASDSTSTITYTYEGDLSTTFEHTVAQGWNVIGWSSPNANLNGSLSTINTSLIESNTLHWYNPDTESFILTDHSNIKANFGYWIKCTQSGTITITPNSGMRFNTDIIKINAKKYELNNKPNFTLNEIFTITNDKLQFMLLEWNYNKEIAIIKYGHISKWDVSQVTSFKRLFYFTPNFNEGISNWNTSNVTDMSYMFYNCTKFNHDISGWNVEKVVDFTGMFKRIDREFIDKYDNDNNVDEYGSPNIKFFEQ